MAKGINTLALNVDCCVHLAVVMHSTRGARPFPIVQREPVVDEATRGTHLARREEPVDLDEVLAPPRHLVIQHTRELVPRRIERD